ncbi:hypothetical protein ATN37_25450 [Rhodococcus sp. MH15]|uniref:hybrid sensor histidine kinase/response regulator n=2 Tax=unclassified Rhodococcus (in: high G+C Gram-positive bacteria) TaxID=192944 RepID=UPI001D7352A4|nr:response regulator [Rhodococcus sp. MH15]MBW0294010.1 hypothetical protein [Rhodococcus sp. MH15]
MSQRRVLVVDDEVSICESIAARLRAEGYDVELAFDGPSAVARCEQMDADLVVLDVMMPGFDGLEVCRRIQAVRPVPVLMLTARADETDMLIGLGVGADDYLSKPFSMRVLVARVQALLRRADRAEHAARPVADLLDRRELIGNVSHELRTPITALQAMLENVVDGVEEPDPAMMKSALRQTERLGALVADLLDLSKLEGGAMPLKRRRFEVEPFLRELSSVSAGDIEIDVKPPQLSVVADPDRLHQVVTNLVDNAVQHGNVDTKVVIRVRTGSAGELVLDVHDDGPGIEPQARERVFDRFIRGGSTDGGTGLGLAIAKWAVELHDGRIAVVDAPSGCCIRVVLPQN